jgi:hypothetical protein
MQRALVLAAAAFLIAAPISLAQTNPPTTPPTTQAPTVTPPATPPAAEPTTPRSATPATPAAPSATTASTSSTSPEGCRTRKEAGEACACLSDTNRIGTSTAHPDGYNVCVRPA